jgi:hypothetical protein
MNERRGVYMTRRTDYLTLMEFLTAEGARLPKCTCRGPLHSCRRCRWEWATEALRRLVEAEAASLRPVGRRAWRWVDVGWGDEGEGRREAGGTGGPDAPCWGAGSSVARRTDYQTVMHFLGQEGLEMPACTCEGPLDLCRRCSWLAATEALRRLVAGEAEALRPDFWRPWERGPAWGEEDSTLGERE